VKINQPLVDSHFVGIPSLGALTTRRFTGGNPQMLGRQAHWTFNPEILGFGSLDQLGADLLKRLDITRGQSDADAVFAWRISKVFISFIVRHFGGRALLPIKT